jgi:RNA polymerase sigma-70 factor (ECF subfamily)
VSKAEWVKIAMQRFEGRLVRYSARFVPEDQAREIVQETFLRLWQQDQAEVEGHLAEWLFRVCRNQAIDLCRKEKHLSRAEGGADMASDEDQKMEWRVDANRAASKILKHIAKLPASQQEVLRLKFQEDLSYKQISAITGHSVSHVGVLIHTAITRLRQTGEVK